ncbi:protein of unknown function DUF1779 [Caldalkalibacillus thermarum TA2.A1]|uniref:YwmB family TATA-box binding protein n=1 Tax=Caldalkalibacillus thermarum (strain TA2.A1) TaxID=986075 RepID=F5LA57_CALTT|nr:YwmB family TATA-box binding protein [Caldalkalibacillus thermarum]EGL81777.1 protein of unknown function DUF1779 [Caldalkalibacillus thermarum TA2.A1]QZT34152.1 YwmB family TATA-box binding protein [Caldalkalibacillus thermarum TA2.A1]
MRLSWGEGILGFMALVLPFVFLLVWGPHSHIEALTRTIQGNDHLVDTIARPTQEMADMLAGKPVTITQWTVYWRGTLTAQEEEEWRTRLTQTGFSLQQNRADEVHGHPLLREHWTKSENGSIHRLQVIKDPHETPQAAKYIYVWSGTANLDQLWLDELRAITQTFFIHLKHFPESFSCLEAITHGRLKDGLLGQRELKQWLTNDLQADLVHELVEDRFVSLNGYVPSWDHVLYSANQEKINVHLSARYNALQDTTRITIGYPLILKTY